MDGMENKEILKTIKSQWDILITIQYCTYLLKYTTFIYKSAPDVYGWIVGWLPTSFIQICQVSKER